MGADRIRPAAADRQVYNATRSIVPTANPRRATTDFDFKAAIDAEPALGATREEAYAAAFGGLA